MTGSMDRLIAWYSSQCNGDWEHQHGFKITTCDNPAIGLKIDLNQTPLEGRDFACVKYNYDSDSDWLICEKTEDNFFSGVCSPHLFGKVLTIFLDWADEV